MRPEDARRCISITKNPIEQIRMRTSKQKEVIILQSQSRCGCMLDNDATLYLVQNCETKKY